MGFKKPFRAVPIRLGQHYRQKAKRERAKATKVVFLQAVALGLVLAAASVVFERPARLLWRATTEDSAVTSERERSVYYSGCAEASRAGAAPIYKGEPGYRPEMDGDSDGIACEPYRRW